ncbi:MAG: RecQ family ATP-dependent DNA helicase [Bacteroidetes bacterium]|nr:RecQ family ATP-dependent DNA helicase [Bacteroidota bacterium]
MIDIYTILKQYWGYDAFRPMQEDIIQSVLAGKDTLALMPTGGGKSLCYQVPAMQLDGLCLVISPLIALMKDQVENLRRKNITAYAIYSGMSWKQVKQTFEVVTQSNCRFLYVSPERLETPLFKEYLPGMNVQLIAVDEAHCISQWGYDFRPPYLRIAALREELPGVPVLALTASATPEVQEDICDKLSQLPGTNSHAQPKKDWQVFRQSFERPNLSYSVFRVDSRIHKTLEILKKVPGTSIVYCKSRKRTKEISDLLQLQGIAADYYHAGLSQEDRNKKQEAWIADRTRVIVCTNAFGMGIDKPGVRTVIHADIPDCLENYYQEAGRAGRDGKSAYAVLLYNDTDLVDPEEMAAMRFPSLSDIRSVYQAVANYLQVPAGSGQGQYFDFDISDFLVKFKLAGHTTTYALKALEQDGWISFNEQVFVPSRVVFTTDKKSLYSFEEAQPALEPCIKMLLRSYEGIYDMPVFISEKMLAGLLKTDADTIKKQLTFLHTQGIIAYDPQKDSPQVYFIRARIPAEELQIDMTGYQSRRKQYLLRVQQMQDFVKDETRCRSRVIGQYFGDAAMKACGICDNCLRQKRSVLSQEEFTAIQQQISSTLTAAPLSIKELCAKLNHIPTEKFMKVLAFLQEEGKIKMNSSGMLEWGK